MKKKYIILIACLTLAVGAAIFVDFTALFIFKADPAPLNGEGKNLAQELGLPAHSKLLVINGDDTCAHPSFTEGILSVIKAGIVKSTSVIVHNSNEAELARMAAAAQKYPYVGVGVHLMLTNEYQQRYPWSPVLSRKQVPSLYNQKGLAWTNIEEVVNNANPEHVTLELEAQVRRAQAAGLKITFLDSHMGTLYKDSKFPGAPANALRQAMISTAQKFNLPMTMRTFNKSLQGTLKYMDRQGIIRPNVLIGFYDVEELNSYLPLNGGSVQKKLTAMAIKMMLGFDLPYTNFPTHRQDLPVRMKITQNFIRRFIKPGLNHMYMHPATAGVYTIPSGFNHKPGEDKIVRLGDRAMWSSPYMKGFLKDEGIVIINYSQLQKIQEARNTKKGPSS